MSGKSIGFLDPHKVCFNNDYSGKEYVIEAKLLEGEIRDQFEPFQEVFDFDFRKEHYKSTLFRFPLRTCPSKLSDTKYTKDKVDKLFESLEEEASIILLFMKNIEHISVYERHSDANSVKRIFKVEIAPEKRESVKQERQRMMNAVERSCVGGAVQDLESESSYVVDACFVNSQSEKSFKWLVLNQIGLEGHERITELSQKLSLPTWVGCAVPLNENAQKENSGRIFCFLPLPRDVDYQTGLPVLVHGAFGVRDNRRGLLWPGSECQNNETAEWNVLLVKKILTSVIYNAVESLITDVPVTELDEKLRRELVYSTVPKPDSVVGHWECVLRPLFEKLRQLNMFHAQSSEGTSWITLGEGLLDQMKQDGVLEKTGEAVLETLLQKSQVIIKDLPDHLCKIVKEYFGDRRDITPDFVRNFLRNQSIQIASHDDKLLLLQYVLHDNPQPEALSDIPLLPLASGEFATFTEHRHISEKSMSVFVPKDSCTEDLLPNMEDRFLKKNIGEETYQKLLTMATNLLDEVNPTQLVTLTPKLVIECLRLSLPDEWFITRNLKDIVSWKPSYPSHPPEKWINFIWHWINDTFESLEQFENIPLIPLESNSEKALGVLSKNSRFIFNSDSSQNIHLPSKVVGLLEAAGCIVLPCTSTLLHVRHPDISSYIASPVSAEVAKMLSKSSMESAKEYIKTCTRVERKEIQNFFASSHMFSEEEKSVVLRLPLLDTLDGAFTAAIVNGHFLNVASWKFELPIGFNFLKASQIISSNEPESSKLVNLLDLEPIEPADIFCRFLFPDIQQEQYSQEETTKIMIWILERNPQLNPQFLNKIKELSFVSTRNGELKKPSELYDPNDPILADLFLGEDNKFPSKEFSKLFSSLKELGLHSKEMMTSSDLLGVAAKIDSSDYRDALKKVQALVTIFQQTPKFLHSDLTQHLAEFKWLPRAIKHPRGMGYPTFMHNEWYSSDISFYKPKELFRESHALLVGSSAPILGVEANDEVQTLLGVQKDVNVNIVMGHLKNAVSVWEEKKRSEAQFIEMVKEIYVYLSKQSSEDVSKAIYQHSLVNWIWHGAGFCSPKQIVLEKDLPFEFRPPFFLLPEALNDGEVLTSFFKTCGVREQFSKEDIILVLADIKEAHEKPSQKITLKRTEKDLKFCRSVLEWLVNDGQMLSEELRRRVFVPVQSVKNKLVLKECYKCTYCDQDWLKHGKSDLDIPDDFYLIHESIPPKLAPLLGIPSLSSSLLSAESIEFEPIGSSFSMFEKLTAIIKNILKSYPCDVGILKELVQNADDAKATEVHFIYDKRTLAHERVVQNNANEVQGPALCVYNNKFFSEDDFKGIYKLRIGSKQNDPSKIGQYGIGFNTVYHLTDCPSFLSNDDTLCILDPHCKYSPEATQDAPGGRYSNIDDEFKDAFSDTVRGYLGDFGDHFPLKGSTMFRLPLRTVDQASTSEISDLPVTYIDITRLMREFEKEAKLSLLFLNHVKKIGLWEINENSDLKLLYSVSSRFERTYQKKLHELHRHLKKHKDVATREIPVKDATYTISIENEQLREEWLIHQRFGIGTEAMTDEETPNVKDLGLFPRGGIAALLSTSGPNKKYVGSRNKEHVACCFLPLPVTTSLPVHVNGHFALDGSRRDLWFDPGSICRRTIWNAFMKKKVLGPAYASLIIKAREHIPNCEKDVDKIYFLSQEDVKKALEWYHNLFPDPTADKWEAVSVAVYQCSKESEILPVVSQQRVIVAAEGNKPDECRSNKSPKARSPGKCTESSSGSESFRNASTKYFCHQPHYCETATESKSEKVKTARLATVDEKRANKLIRYYIEWLTPNRVYFTEEEKREKQNVLLAALLRICMPILLYTPLRIHDALKKLKMESHVLAPENVIQFLLTWQDECSRCSIGKLPIELSSSNIQNKLHLQSILEYCKETLQTSLQSLQGLPLLLTGDNMLRAFSSESPVYCTLFSKLFPDKCFKFVHLDFVQLLSAFCGVEPGVIRDLTIKSLAIEFMPDVFEGKLPLDERKHVSWNYPEKGVLSKEWFSCLWKFLCTAAEPKSNERVGDPMIQWLCKYPIIPTTDGKLATVGNAKSVLAVTYSASPSYLKQEVTEILKNLTCPFLDEPMTKFALYFVRRLVADPHCESDVLHVLDYMNETGILDMSKFSDRSINTLLTFFQTDSKSKKSMNIAKTLPFYKGVDGGYHALSSYLFYVKVPAGLPDHGIKQLQTVYGKRILFLPPLLSTDLDRLYKALGIKVDCDIPKLFITYVLPNFSCFTSECQKEFLANIKGLSAYHMTDELIEKLKCTKCIPDQTDNLRLPSSYFNPHNELFKVMFKQEGNAFPKAPFSEQNWISFLVQIGMKKNCDEQQFIKFAREVQNSARYISDYDQNIVTQSKSLVTYLLQSGTNWNCSIISEIQFIIPEEVEEELSFYHAQYCVDGKLEFVSYGDSIRWKDRHLVWTSAKLLPSWACPRNYNFCSSLGIPSKPPLESVAKHVKIISKCASELVKSEHPLNKIIEVFGKVYDFLEGLTQKCAKEPTPSCCNPDCLKIGNLLESVACILLSKERQLVKGEGLSFEDTHGKLKPHFHVVPREYFQYEHLLKRLGVTEKLSALQMSHVLESIKDSCAEDTMNPREEEKACFATSVLFKSLHGDATEVESRLSNCKDLYLPSMKNRLVKSNELVCQMQPRLRDLVAKLDYEVLYPLEKCGLKRELEGEYLGSLPKRLRPTPLNSLVREELHPNCKEYMTCDYCEKMDCAFIQKIILVLRSLQFQRGILRLLKHQKETSTLKDEDRARAARFTSEKVSFILWCQESIFCVYLIHF